MLRLYEYKKIVDEYLEITQKLSEALPHIFKLPSKEQLLLSLEKDGMEELPEILLNEIERRKAIYELVSNLRTK